jgi:hypothetical protein
MASFWGIGSLRSCRMTIVLKPTHLEGLRAPAPLSWDVVQRSSSPTRLGRRRAARRSAGDDSYGVSGASAAISANNSSARARPMAPTVSS